MTRFDITDAIYCRLFPVILLICAASGVMVYFVGEHSLALDCFIAVAFGIRLDSHIDQVRYQQAEEAASQGWSRLRAPVHTA